MLHMKTNRGRTAETFLLFFCRGPFRHYAQMLKAVRGRAAPGFRAAHPLCGPSHPSRGCRFRLEYFLYLLLSLYQI